MKKTRMIALLCVIAMLCTMFTACGSNEKTAETVANAAQAETPSTGNEFKLGVATCLSGSAGAYGTEALKAIEMCVAQINAEGGLNGQPVRVIAYDTLSSTEEAAKVATKLTQVDNVDAVILSVMSSEILACAEIVTDANIIAFGPATSPSWMREEYPYIYRAAMNNDDTIPLDISILEDMKYDSVCIFKGQDDNSVTTAASFAAAAEAAGIQVLSEESYEEGDNDYSAQCLNIVAQDPDVVFLSCNGEYGGVVVKQLRQYGFNGMIVSKESFMVSQVEIAGKENANFISFAMPYVTYTDINDCDIPTMRAFLEDYVETYGELPQTDSSYRGYEAARTLYEAAKIAGANDTESLVNAMKSVKYEGLGGTLDFTQSRNGYATFNRFILVDGKNVLFDTWLNNGGYDAFLTETGRDR